MNKKIPKLEWFCKKCGKKLSEEQSNNLSCPDCFATLSVKENIGCKVKKEPKKYKNIFMRVTKKEHEEFIKESDKLRLKQSQFLTLLMACYKERTNKGKLQVINV